LLHHDEKSSSFKRIQFNTSLPHDYYSGRMINFENMGEYEEKRKVIFRNKDIFSESEDEDDEDDESGEEDSNTNTEEDGEGMYLTLL
jgi:hypothetical protein